MKSARVAVLGTGVMGAGVARSLLRAGHRVSVWNRTHDRAAPLGRSGAIVTTEIGECVLDASVVITLLYDASATLDVKPHLLESMGPEAVWVQSATIGPDGARQVARGVRRFLDAPVLGTRGPAEAGQLVSLVSGAADVAAAARPVIDGYSSRVVEAGPEIGRASALKLVCNAWVDLLVAGVGQSIAMAEQLDLDPALFLRAIEGGPVDAPVAQAKGAAILDDSTGVPSFALPGVVKDIGLMFSAVAATELRTELMVAMRDAYERVEETEYRDHDMAAVWRGFLR
ncbi:NAD(P)-dependent oxidoreductase [Nocardioides sp. YIM 152315]|nr:NAD(P)-dependent oxidoreductase [Nocardioides sp. YIM 152315]MDF1606330.1 NAD(P)-dependent oxidoreductase [Nocardioides sp. YIM 152315]